VSSIAKSRVSFSPSAYTAPHRSTTADTQARAILDCRHRTGSGGAHVSYPPQAHLLSVAIEQSRGRDRDREATVFLTREKTESVTSVLRFANCPYYHTLPIAIS